MWFILLLLFVIIIFAIIILFLVIRKPSESFKNSAFVTWNAKLGQFELNGKPFYATGCNIPWMGLQVDNLSTCFTRPEDKYIEQMLKYARDTLNCNVIRCHTLGFSSTIDTSYIQTNHNDFFITPLGINENYWKVVDLIIRNAVLNNIYLIPVMSDQYPCYNGNYNVFLGDGESPSDFFDINSKAHQNYKNFLQIYLNHKVDGIAIKDHPNIFCIEFGNELGDHSNDLTAIPCDLNKTGDLYYQPCAYDGKPLQVTFTNFMTPTKEWMQATATFIRGIDKNHLLMSGANFCQLPKDVAVYVQTAVCDGWADIKEVDIISYHWYYSVTDIDYSVIENACDNARSKGKAVIFGEYQSDYPVNDKWFKELDTLIQSKRLQGTLFWDLVYQDYKYWGGTDTTMALAPCTEDPKNICDPNHLLPKYAAHFLQYKYNSDPAHTCLSYSECTEICGSTKLMYVIGDSITTGYHCCNDDPSWFACGQCSAQGCCDVKEGKLDKFMDDSTIVQDGYSFVGNCSLSYTEYLVQNLKEPLQIYNFAIQGTTAQPNCTPCQQWRNVPGPKGKTTFSVVTNDDFKKMKPDYIFIALGVNDINKTCGCVPNNPVIVYQGLASLINDLSTSYPDVPYIILNRPLPSSSDQIDQPILSTDFKNMGDEVKKQIGDELSKKLIWVDIYDKVKEKITECSYCDQVHPLAATNKIIGEILAEALDNMKIGLSKGSNTSPLKQTYYQNPQTKSFT